MNRSYSLHPISLLLGVVFAGVCFLSMSQVWPAGQHVVVEYSAHPRDMVQIKQGAPYLVPSGRILVLTALGADSAPSSPTGTDLISFAVNGQREGCINVVMNPIDAPLSVTALPQGRSIRSGSLVTVQSTDPSLSGRTWGYLAKAGSISSPADKMVLVQYRPDPRDMIQIVEGIPFIVPSGKLLVVTALGGTSTPSPPTGTIPEHALLVNGQQELKSVGPMLVGFLVNPLAPVPDGLTIQPGATVEVTQIAGTLSPARAWGYLASQ